jgi:hypothetical protein
MAGWTNLESALPLARAFGSSAVRGDFLYVVGGSNEVAATFTTYRNQILRARIASDGNLSQWVQVGVLPSSKLSPSLFIHGDMMYVIGGIKDADPGSTSSGHQVLSAKLNASGDLQGAGLVPMSELPVSVESGGVAFSKNYLYVVGGTKKQTALTYDTASGNFQVGEDITGVTSGATGVIYALVADAGTTGTLGIDSIAGTFQNGELLHGALGGRGRASSAMTGLLMDYESKNSGFVVAETIRGMTSAATALVVANTVDANPGTIEISDVTGTFTVGENVRAVGPSIHMVGLPQQRLDYLNGVISFTLGNVIRGLSSGAVGTIIEDDTAVLGLDDASIVGSFTDTEVILGDVTSRALVTAASTFELAYENQTGNFAALEVITGGTSGATATVVSDTDGGATGVLVLSGVTGHFVLGEAITGSVLGAADATDTERQLVTYDTQTIGNFVVGERIYGATGSFLGTVVGDTDGGTGGVLSIVDYTGTFIDTEVIWGFGGGSAEVDGTLYDLLFRYSSKFPDTANFDNAGEGILVGLFSGAVGTIVSNEPSSPTTGWIHYTLTSGTFANNENVQSYTAVRADVVESGYADINFSGQTGAFAVHEDITGLTSGASLRATSVGATVILGDLTSGTFTNNETIAGSVLGSALANGASAISDSDNLRIMRAAVFSDGGLGPWVDFGVLPGAAPAGNALAVIGETLFFLSDGLLYWARDRGERLDVWSSSSAPASTSYHGLLGVGDRLVLLGGEVSSSDVSSVRCLQIGADGLPSGVWYRTADLPVPLSRFGSAVRGDRIFVVGGRATSASTTKVHTARLVDGLIGGEKS